MTPSLLRMACVWFLTVLTEPAPAPELAPIMSHEPSNPEPAPMNPNAEAARVLEEALAHVESMPRDLAELRR